MFMNIFVKNGCIVESYCTFIDEKMIRNIQTKVDM